MPQQYYLSLLQVLIANGNFAKEKINKKIAIRGDVHWPWHSWSWCQHLSQCFSDPNMKVKWQSVLTSTTEIVQSKIIQAM